MMLMLLKIAACFGAFVTAAEKQNTNGTPSSCHPALFAVTESLSLFVAPFLRAVLLVRMVGVQVFLHAFVDCTVSLGLFSFSLSPLLDANSKTSR
jgi:hypothetical protein